MKITKFNKIKARTYKDFTWPSDLPEFADYNLIYGWNGSGKTTLADILRMIEKRQSIGGEGINEFSITYGTRTISNANIATDTAPPSIRVFNRAFIETNVFAANGAAPIFFIGEENIEKQKDLERQRKDLGALKVEVVEKNAEKGRKEKELTVLGQSKASEIRAWLGITSQNSYHKGHFAADCNSLASSGEWASHSKTSEELDALKKTIACTVQEKIQPISADLPDLGIIAGEAKAVLQKTVLSQTIDFLTKDQRISGWVKEGLQIHKEHKSETCQFCQQRIPADRLKELEGHFNDEFNALDASLCALISDVEKKILALGAVQNLTPANLYSDLTTKHRVASQRFNEQVSECVGFLSLLKASLQDKKGKPFVTVDFDLAIPDYAPTQLVAINSIIDEHNKRTENFQETINEARQSIKSAIAASCFEQYQELISALKSLEAECTALDDKIKAAEQNITSLEQEIINHKKPAEEINQDLQNYLGHDELRFATSDSETGYRIMRGDKPAHALSEGEKTAIALLHFLKSLEDTKFDLAAGIVVIDDPVCSMDDTALFHAFSHIKERTRNAGQLFVLTHNFSFFRQVKNWFSYVEKNHRKLGKRASFYHTVCSRDHGQRVSGIKPLDKLLLNYESEYQYLFDITYKASMNGNVLSGLEQYYHMPNIARRLLESFLAFRMPGANDGLYHKLERSSFSATKKTGILRFLQTHSHEDHVGQPEHDCTILAETPQILSDILELISFEDQKHYNEMILLVAPLAEAATVQTTNLASAS